MKKYTQKEFENFEINQFGYRVCPTGDYSEIKCFGERCSFGEWCSFGEHCSFGERCSFGEWCSFGECCSFGERCSFGEWCSFGECCSFGEWCSFGECCSFGEDCSCEFGKFTRMLTIGGFGSKKRTTYFFLLENKSLAVRCGCFAGDYDAWCEKVKMTHKGSKYARAYLVAGEAVKIMCEEE